MSKAGDFFQNPVSGETAIVRVGTHESGGELLIADLYLAPGGAVMGEHYHPAIEERFTLIRGELGIRLSGRATKAKSGVTLLVPPGVPHEWWNAGGADAVVRVEIRPAARFEVMILNAFGLAQDGRVDRRGCRTFFNWSSSPTSSATWCGLPSHHAWFRACSLDWSRRSPGC